MGLAFLAYIKLKAMRVREKHAAQLQVREDWFRVTLLSIGDAVVATDAQGLVTFLNPVAEHLAPHHPSLASVRFAVKHPRCEPGA